MHPFGNRADPADLAAEQEVETADDFDGLLGDFWPENESTDEFIAALCRWRHDEGPEA